MNKFASLALAVDTPARMTIRHPGTMIPLVDQDKQEAYIDLLSLDGNAAREYDRKISDTALSNGIRVKLDTAAIEKQSVDRLAALTRGWHLVGLNGQAIDVPFSEADAAQLYAEPAMSWLVEQVQIFIGNRANFVKPSSTL